MNLRKMKKNRTKLIGLKLDVEAIRKIELIMETLNIRSYNEVIRTCINNNITIESYYQYALNLSTEVNNESFLKKV